MQLVAHRDGCLLKILGCQHTQGTLLHFQQAVANLIDILVTLIGTHVEPFGLMTRRLDLLIDQGI
ncbi:hypothetical protein [Xenorhabdus cabanillasii]|uniref:hypothetical protein n=1 Tax=Xenorhabdus cabanillasii TaxID=351673 RepID=UPI001E5CAF68|nr:hypothetical protein [Xenorhabdus cabanillasii]